MFILFIFIPLRFEAHQSRADAVPASCADSKERNTRRPIREPKTSKPCLRGISSWPELGNVNVGDGIGDGRCIFGSRTYLLLDLHAISSASRQPVDDVPP